MTEESGSSRAPDTEGAPPSFRATDHTEGQVIAAKYRLVRRLGEGGMASVWLAHNEALDIEVAIKFIRADLQHPGLTGRLLQEARAAARLGHPAIVRVSDFGKTDGDQPYIVMELLTGEDLAKQIAQRGPLPPVRAVRLLLPIAHALSAAHAKGIVHRDLKPDNVFLHQREGGGVQPKLVDFGIAKLKRDDEQRITQLGSAMGSPAYMSPEQARGLDVDPRADIWAFSIVLYETLTGKLPFDGPTYAALLCAILEGQPKPITELGVPDPQLWALISRGLEKEPERRWESMRELGTALAHWLQARGVADDVTGASLLSTWIDPQAESERPMLPSLSGAPLDEPRASLVQSAGDSATQLSFHDGVPVQPRTRKLSSLVAIGGSIGAVLLLGGVVVFMATRTKPSAEPPPTVAAPEAPKTELAPLAATTTGAPAPTPPPVASAPPAVEPTAAPEAEEPRPIAAKKPARPTGKAPPAKTAPAKTATPSKPTAEAPKTAPKPKPAESDLDIKTNL